MSLKKARDFAYQVVTWIPNYNKWGYDIVYPCVGILLNTCVTLECLYEVNKVRNELQIIEPSNKCKDTTKKIDKNKWERTNQIYIDCIYRSVVESNTFIIGIILAQNHSKYGNWILRILGTFSICNAYYRRNVCLSPFYIYCITYFLFIFH